MKMKVSQPLLKMTIRILILLILFVCLFLISAFLYSVRYWPDVYNYINANITIKRIPTISELDIQIIEVSIDYTTETYSTTDMEYYEISTIDDFDIDEFMRDELDVKHKTKRNIKVEEMKDYKELPSRSIFVDYIFLEEPIEMNGKGDTNKSDILKTVITGKVLEDTNNVVETKLDDNAKETEENNNNDSINKILKRMINSEYTNNQDNYTIEHTTTNEGYLVGDGEKIIDDQPTIEPLEITIDVNENDDYDPELTLMKDLVDVSKLTTRSLDVEMVTGKPAVALQRMSDPVCHGNPSCMDFVKTVYPWVVTIFIKNDTGDSQFQYNCDGVLLSEKVILTGGRCMILSNKIVEPEQVLVFLGKGNLQNMDGKEKLHRIKEIMLHQNFTLDKENNVVNDLAMLTIEDRVQYTDYVQSACIHLSGSDDLEEAGTVSWGPNGDLLPIFFEKEKSELCYDRNEDIFCATYGNDVALCPNYGGIYVAKRSSTWCIEGVFYGDPANRGLCFDKNVLYTSLNNYIRWIYHITEVNKIIV